MPDALSPMNQAVYAIVPEIILLATVCVMLLLGPFLVDEASKGQPGMSRRWTVLSLLALGIGGWAFLESKPIAADVPFMADSLTYYVRMLTFVLGPMLVLTLTRQIDDGSSAEAHACLLTILAGVNFIALASDLVGLFIALELVSIPTYVFLYLPRRDAAMQEAVLKYFLLNIFSSALVLYGISWLFGAAGTTHFREIAERLGGETGETAGPLVLVAAALLIAGLSFRLAAVPFHFYAPDVFQGANAAGAAMLSVVPKVAGFAALIRVLDITGLLDSLGAAAKGASIEGLLAVLAIATMTLGNLLALRQQRLQRLLAFSSIAHSGYMLAGLAVGLSSPTVTGVAALWFYLAIYGITTIGLFALLASVGVERPMQDDHDLTGLSQIHPTIAVLTAVCLFGLAGLPPTAGFTGKLNLFLASWTSTSDWGMWLAGAIALNAAVGAWYYLRLIALMYREKPADAPERGLAYAPAVAGAACAAGSMALFVAPQHLWDLAAAIAG